MKNIQNSKYIDATICVKKLHIYTYAYIEYLWKALKKLFNCNWPHRRNYLWPKVKTGTFYLFLHLLNFIPIVYLALPIQNNK